jgi:cytochrome oxidase Cu insertion factor (SCO1/SenC/PrrC family)
MKRIIIAATAVLGLALGAADAGAAGGGRGGLPQDPKAPGSGTQPGLKVGERAAAFQLKDQSGKERSLDEFRAKGKVALVFFRSADW